MKKFYFLALLTTACASHPVASNSPQVARDLAGTKDSAGTFSAKLPAAMYQGPFEINPENAGARETVNQWLKKNGCQDRPAQGWQKDFVLPISGVNTKETSWKNCTSGKGVSLWTIQSFDNSWHNPHVPLFNFGFTDAVLDFLFQHRNSNLR
jgi:poly(3-hydroxybutyrate) depolymerase